MFKNLALAAASLALTILLLEFLVVPIVLPLLPLKLHAALPRPMRVLAQSSKAAAVPVSYIALLGDSYAQGAGDWLLEADPKRNDPFHTAHLLNAETGRDVITFGASGAGSLRSLVTDPIVYLRYLNRTLIYRTRDPDTVLVYFYEGNDLDDNLEDLRLRFDPAYDRSRVGDPEYFRSFIEQTVIGESEVAVEEKRFRWTDQLAATRFAVRIIEAILAGESVPGSAPADSGSREVNRGRVAGTEVELPDGLQGPALTLSESELELALYVFGEALRYNVERFRASRVVVIFLPSPLSTYELTSPIVSIQLNHQASGADLYPTSKVLQRTDWICDEVSRLANEAGAEFLDARPALWEEASRRFLHGPKDWKHFNRLGQEVLVGAILPVLEQPGAADGKGCGTRPFEIPSSAALAE